MYRHSESDHESSENLIEKPHERKAQRGTSLWTVLNIVLFCSSVLLCIVSYIQAHPSELEMLKRTSFYSPVWDSINLHTYDTIINGNLFNPNLTDKFRDYYTKNASVDKAWESLEPIRVFPISEAQIRKLGKDPELSVKFPPDYGLGDDAYMGQIDMFHQLHCLGLMRYQAWKEYDHNATLHREPYGKMHWVHLSHCTDILLKNIMCSGSLDIVTYTWLETQDNPWPDFNVPHKCRSFDDIVEWQEKHSVPLTWGRNVTRPKDFREVKVPEEFYMLNNWTREEVAAAALKGPKGHPTQLEHAHDEH